MNQIKIKPKFGHSLYMINIKFFNLIYISHSHAV